MLWLNVFCGVHTHVLFVFFGGNSSQPLQSLPPSPTLHPTLHPTHQLINQLFQPTLSTNSSPGTTAADDHVLDLDGLVLAYVDVQSALQAAQAERDYYANECADRMVRREVRQCMMAGQPTGAVGALRWDLVQGRVRTCALV